MLHSLSQFCILPFLGPSPGLCFVFGRRDSGGGGGYEAKKGLCTGSLYLKWASHFWLSVQTFIFPSRKLYLGLGARVDPPEPPPPCG